MCGTKVEFDASYRAMAQDEARETEALALSEATILDASDERRYDWL